MYSSCSNFFLAIKTVPQFLAQLSKDNDYVCEGGKGGWGKGIKPVLEYLWKTKFQKDICALTLFTTAKIWKQPNCPSMDKMEYYLAIKNNKILPFVAAWMDIGGTVLSEMGQTGKDRYCVISLLCGIK